MKTRFSRRIGQATAAAFAVALAFSCSDPSHDSSEEPLLGAEHSLSCSVRQGFDFEQDYQGLVGFLISMNIAGQELTPDFRVTDPEMPDSGFNVVGVISGFYWKGGFANPVYFSSQVSNSNKNKLSTLLHQAMENTETRFEFVIYDYDPGAHAYFRCMHSGGVQLRGRIEKSGGELSVSIDSNPSGEIETPENFTFNVGVMPAAIHQLIFAAFAVDKKIVKPWGIAVGA